jgi:signal peptidase I
MTRTASPKTPKPTAKAQPPQRKETNRDTVESIVVAVILALLIRSFEAEAFVIPTGSMAPTLMGRHKEVDCTECGHRFAVNAHAEEDARLFADDRKVKFGVCDNCRFSVALEDQPSFKGDRILVMKFPYDLPFLPGASPPQRWDVVVFKFPGNPEQNYIKRLVGLPGEEVQILGGDLFVRPAGTDQPFLLAHKPLEHQRAMQMPVYDDAYRPRALADRPEWRRWKPRDEERWTETEPGTFVSQPGTDWTHLEYHHLIPTPDQWDDLRQGRTTSPPRPTLITDFYAYNSNFNRVGAAWHERPHWMGDLTLSFDLKVNSPTGNVAIDLVKGGVPHRWEIDVKTGMATLSRAGEPLKSVETSVKGEGSHEVAFANVDGRLTLWIDGGTPFGDGVVYDDGTQPRPVPTEADLRPVTVSTRGGSFEVSGLRLQRDIYYTLSPKGADYLGHDTAGFGESDAPRQIEDLPHDPRLLHEKLGDPSAFAALAVSPGRVYPIAPEKYMMMGDNSPESYDGRAWDRADRNWDSTGRESWEVPATMIVGKAFFVYWPHGKPFWPDLAISRDFRVPFRPYVERMKWIR